MFEKLKKKGFQVLALHHAEAILKHDMADAVTELERVLLSVQIPIVELKIQRASVHDGSTPSPGTTLFAVGEETFV